MRASIETLDHLYVVHGGTHRFPLADTITAVPASDVLLGSAVGPGGRHLYIRQLQDQKASAVVEAMTKDLVTFWAA